MKYLKILIVLLILSLIGGGIYYYFSKSKEDTVKEEVKNSDKYITELLKNYDIAITRKDVNCLANTIYLRDNAILVIGYQDNNSNEAMELLNKEKTIKIKEMTKYVLENGKKDVLEGFYIILKDGTTRTIKDEGNIIADFLKENNINETCGLN